MVNLERWHEQFGMLVLFVWVTRGQLDSTPIFNLHTSSLLPLGTLAQGQSLF